VQEREDDEEREGGREADSDEESHPSRKRQRQDLATSTRKKGKERAAARPEDCSGGSGERELPPHDRSPIRETTEVINISGNRPISGPDLSAASGEKGFAPSGPINDGSQTILPPRRSAKEILGMLRKTRTNNRIRPRQEIISAEVTILLISLLAVSEQHRRRRLSNVLQ
jgi:hypothetical protein